MLRLSARRLLQRKPLSRTFSASEDQDLTTDVVVSELSSFIIGQDAAKKAVAIALRSRWRRTQLADAEMMSEITPFNILLVGPTGTGKTEISRRLASLAHAPFVKTEATKFTEVGIYGQDTSSMVKDLVEVAYEMEREKALEAVSAQAALYAEELLLDALCGATSTSSVGNSGDVGGGPADDSDGVNEVREMMRGQLREEKLDDRTVEVVLDSNVTKKQPLGRMLGDDDFALPPALEEMARSVTQMLPPTEGGVGMDRPTGPQPTQMSVAEARRRLCEQEEERLVCGQEEELGKRALESAQQRGIIFVDEIDKLASPGGAEGGGGGGRSGSPFNKGEGVQKELLALTEGGTVATRLGPAKTDHILFICSGAFHVARVSDLLPELQGRLPIKVSLDTLTKADLVAILTKTRFNLVEQCTALLATEGVRLTFTSDAIEEMASCAVDLNARLQDIGARRLHTVISSVTESISFDAHNIFVAAQGEGEEWADVVIDADYVRKQLGAIMREKQDLDKYIL